MANNSTAVTGRYDEQLAELREIVGALPKSTSDAQRMRKVALATLEAMDAKPADTVHVSVNAGRDGSGGTTWTVTATHTPAPVERR